MDDFDLLIIGTGSGNSLLNEEFSSWKVGIIERSVFGGTCLNAGCIPSKMFVLPADRMREAAEATERLNVDIEARGADFAGLRDRVFGRIDPIASGGTRYRQEQQNVTVFLGDAHFIGERTLSIELQDGTTQIVTAKQIVIAAGARPHLPELKGLDQTPFHTSDSIMRIEELPEHLMILGGGFIAAELGHVFSALGSRVSVIHRGATMLRHADQDISSRFTAAFAEQVELHLGTQAVSVQQRDEQLELTLRNDAGDQFVLSGDALLVATGRTPNGAQLEVGRAGVEVDSDGYIITDSTLLTDAPGVWALGDVRNSWQLKHLANQEARVVGHNLLNPNSPISIDQRVVPHAVFSHPQIGSVGLTEQELRASGQKFIVGSCEYSNVAFGWAMEDQTGIAKILIDPANFRILGAHVLGPQAATLMQQLSQAMQFNIPADRLAREQIWCHPALPEVLENALLSAL